MSKQKSLNVGLVGYGFMGRTHSNAFSKVNNFFELDCRPVLKAVCGRDEVNVKAFAERWGYESTETDWRKLLSRSDIDLVDIAAVSQIARAVGARVVVDNVFATPLLQKPLQLGADVVVYSATKHVDGQGRCLGGVVLGSQSYVKDHLHNYLKHTGPSLSPFNAWVMLKGLETLPLRVRAQCEGAARIADHLATQQGVTRVLYCGRAASTIGCATAPSEPVTQAAGDNPRFV